ncbi:MAG: ABC transporter ATP-binding protein, partial [Clostridiales bacterium]|nr:ABC transporter ATP-binding protein [Clostridiales bacterium]
RDSRYALGLFGSLLKLVSKEWRLNPIKGLMPDPTNLPKGCRFHDRCPGATEMCAASAPEEAEVAPGHFIKCFYAGVR